MPEAAKPAALAPESREGVQGGDVSDDAGHAEEEERVAKECMSQEEARKAEEAAAEQVWWKAKANKVASDKTAAARTLQEKANEAAAKRTSTNKTAIDNAAQEQDLKVAEDLASQTAASASAAKRLEKEAVWASTDVTSGSGAEAGTVGLEERADEAANHASVEVEADHGDMSRTSPAVQVGKTGHGEAEVTPEAVAKNTPRGSGSAVPDGSSAGGSQGSVGRLQRE
jgi:hypothetical protein